MFLGFLGWAHQRTRIFRQRLLTRDPELFFRASVVGCARELVGALLVDGCFGLLPELAEFFGDLATPLTAAGILQLAHDLLRLICVPIRVLTGLELLSGFRVSKDEIRNLIRKLCTQQPIYQRTRIFRQRLLTRDPELFFRASVVGCARELVGALLVDGCFGLLPELAEFFGDLATPLTAAGILQLAHDLLRLICVPIRVLTGLEHTKLIK